AGEGVRVGGAVSLGPLVRVVEGDLGLVAAEAAVVPAVYRQVLVDAGQDGLAVAALEQGRRKSSRRGPGGGTGGHGPVAPDLVRLFRPQTGIGPGVRRGRRHPHTRDDIGDTAVS